MDDWLVKRMTSWNKVFINIIFIIIIIIIIITAWLQASLDDMFNSFITVTYVKILDYNVWRPLRYGIAS